MPLYEYDCLACKIRFEELTAHVPESDRGKCPKCGGKNTQRAISKFRVAGQGDLRETTLHGCHDAHVGGPNEGHGDGHGDHDH